MRASSQAYTARLALLLLSWAIAALMALQACGGGGGSRPLAPTATQTIAASATPTRTRAVASATSTATLPLPTPTATPATPSQRVFIVPTLERPAIVVDPAAARLGEVVQLNFRFRRGVTAVAALQNEIYFTDELQILTRGDDGKPDCRVNPDLDKPATAFAIVASDGCERGNPCTTVRALVVAVDNVDPIADGALLYTCNARMPDTAPAHLLGLGCGTSRGSDPQGKQLAVDCLAASVMLLDDRPASTPTPRTPQPTAPPPATPTAPARPVLYIESTAAHLGEILHIDFRFKRGRNDIVAFENEIYLDDDLPILARANGRPDCAVNPDLDKGATSFAFAPPNCTPGEDCDKVRALVLAIDNLDPVADGALVYTCTVQMPDTAPAHLLGLACGNARGSDEHGNSVQLDCVSGGVRVLDANPGTPTPTVPQFTPTPLNILPQPCAAACGDRRIDAGEQCDDGNCVDGDGCAYNCTNEQAFSGALGSGSFIIFSTPLFSVTAPLRGRVAVLAAGDRPDLPEEGADIFPVVLRAEIEPVVIPGVGCACLRSRPEAGGELGLGYLGCSSEVAIGGDYSCRIDHDNRDEDPRCEAGSPDLIHPGACNSALTCDFDYAGVEGTMVFDTLLDIRILDDGGLCSIDTEDPTKGPDGRPCTDDDPPTPITVIESLLTTTSATSNFGHFDNRPGRLRLSSTFADAPVSCSEFATQGFRDLVLAGVYPAIDVPHLGDTVFQVRMGATLLAETP